MTCGHDGNPALRWADGSSRCMHMASVPTLITSRDAPSYATAKRGVVDGLPSQSMVAASAAGNDPLSPKHRRPAVTTQCEASGQGLKPNEVQTKPSLLASHRHTTVTLPPYYHHAAATRLDTTLLPQCVAAQLLS